MARIRGTFSQRWELVENAAFAGMEPRIMVAACHDRSPFITIRCRCGCELHQHETRVSSFPDDAELASRCLGCGELLVFPPGFFREAFAGMRRDGWIE